jgi:hypothetical protein
MLQPYYQKDPKIEKQFLKMAYDILQMPIKGNASAPVGTWKG